MRRVVAGVRLRDRDARPRPVIFGFAERYDDVQAVHGAALKDGDELLGAAERPCANAVRARNDGANPRLTSAKPPFFKNTLREIMSTSLAKPRATFACATR